MTKQKIFLSLATEDEAIDSIMTSVDLSDSYLDPYYTSHEIEAVTSGIQSALESIEAISKIRTIVQNNPTLESLRLAEIAVNSAKRSAFIPIEESKVSLESDDEESTEEKSDGILASIKNFFIAIWEKIKAALTWIIDKIASFFTMKSKRTKKDEEEIKEFYKTFKERDPELFNRVKDFQDPILNKFVFLHRPSNDISSIIKLVDDTIPVITLLENIINELDGRGKVPIHEMVTTAERAKDQSDKSVIRQIILKLNNDSSSGKYISDLKPITTVEHTHENKEHEVSVPVIDFHIGECLIKNIKTPPTDDDLYVRKLLVVKSTSKEVIEKFETVSKSKCIELFEKTQHLRSKFKDLDKKSENMDESIKKTMHSLEGLFTGHVINESPESRDVALLFSSICTTFVANVNTVAIQSNLRINKFIEDAESLVIRIDNKVKQSNKTNDDNKQI